MTQEHSGGGATARIGWQRLMVGLLQGLAAWRLLELVEPVNVVALPHHSALTFWSSQHPMAFAALALITGLVPPIAIAQLGRLRRRTFWLYLLAATVALALLAGYDIWRDPVTDDADVRVWPSGALCIQAALGLFIANQLIEHRARGLGLFAAYDAHFEDGWMRGFQVVISLIFTLLFWGVMVLGGALFEMIKITWLNEVLQRNWFRCPSIAVAFAAAVHLTDVRPGLLKGMRNVGLTLLSWLLPVVVTLDLGFLAALTITGPGPLWATQHAAAILVWAAAVTLFLVNAAYKDGDPENHLPIVLRWAGRLAGPAMLCLSLLAGYAIQLRVSEYGLTSRRVYTLAIVFMSLIYGAGYTLATVRRGAWMHPLERVNVGASLGALALLIALTTPVADPARLAVDSHVTRLAQGRETAAKFDFHYLRFESGRRGREALARLARSANPNIRARALQAQALKTIYIETQWGDDAGVDEPAFSHATVYPKGAALPTDFHPAEDVPNPGPDCLHNGARCDLFVTHWGADHTLAILVVDTFTGNPSLRRDGRLFERAGKGAWVQTGELENLECTDVAEALRAGTARPLRPRHDDILAGGMRLHLRESGERCPLKAPPRPEPPVKPSDARAPAELGPGFGVPR